MDIWAFLADEQNRGALALLGGAVVAVIGGAWAVYKFRASKRSSEQEKLPTVSASGGGIAVGRDVKDSELSTGGLRKPK